MISKRLRRVVSDIILETADDILPGLFEMV